VTASLDDALPSRKEGWILLAESGPRATPKRLSRAALDALSPEAKAAHDRARRVWHANIGPLRTPQMAALHDDLWDIVETNQQDGDKAKGAAAIDGYPGLGKTTAALVFAREYHRRQIAEEGRFTAGGDEHLPVCWIGLGANTTIKALNRTILEFYGHPSAASRYQRATTAQLAAQALDCIMSCRTRLLVVDDIHFLDVRSRDGLEVTNHLKWLANEFPVTFLFAGVSLRERGLMSEGMTPADQARAQTARRWTRLTLDPFHLADNAGRAQWRKLLLAIEKSLVLADQQPGDLADELSGYLFARTTGHIGSLMTLISRSAGRAIRNGQERLTRDLLDRVKADEGAEQSRAPLQAALDAGRLTARSRALRADATAGT
jgi:hypothetical protein